MTDKEEMEAPDGYRECMMYDFREGVMLRKRLGVSGRFLVEEGTGQRFLARDYIVKWLDEEPIVRGRQKADMQGHGHRASG